MSVVHQAVRGVCKQQRHRNDIEVAEGNLVVLLRLLLGFAELVLVLKYNHVWQEREGGVRGRRAQADINSLGDLPGFQEDTKALTGENHPRSVVAVVHKVEEDDTLHEDVRQDGADRGTDNVLLLAPVGLRYC